MPTGTLERDFEKQEVSGYEFLDIVDLQGWSSMEPEHSISEKN
jgi:hypothetical protein